MESYFIMTIDVDPPFSSKMDHVIEEGLTLLLNFLDRYSIKSTFFVPATVAEKFSDTMNEIVKLKHEIACHGLKHEPLEATLDIYKQVRNIKIATEIIESATGIRPKGFRAPLFKINKNCWIALYKNAYIYDSSVVCSPFYGNYTRTFMRSRPYYLAAPSRDEDFNLLEIPVSANPFFPFPLGGGWFRIFGSRWAKIGVKTNFIFKTPTVFYIHPKDIVVSESYSLPWYYCRNTFNSLVMLSEIIQYAKRNGAKFLTAYELAKKFERK